MEFSNYKAHELKEIIAKKRSFCRRSYKGSFR